MVEDDDRAREVAISMLQALGSKAVPVTDGDTAAGLLEETGVISLLFATA